MKAPIALDSEVRQVQRNCKCKIGPGFIFTHLSTIFRLNVIAFLFKLKSLPASTAASTLVHSWWLRKCQPTTSCQVPGALFHQISASWLRFQDRPYFVSLTVATKMGDIVLPFVH